jgi:Delta3-Delta2-enoyl-CoA isomerase
MQYVSVSREGKVATVVLSRGKVNALNEEVVDELKTCFEHIAEDPDVAAVLLTGTGRFFSFGFDVPEFMNYSREDFAGFLTKFAVLYTYLYVFPKPLIAVINGHAIAGGCMLATACDYRIMVDGKAKISLNEVTFGSSVFAGSVEMLKSCTGTRNAEIILLTGAMYGADEALEVGLIDRKTSPDNLVQESNHIAQRFVQADLVAFLSIKKLLREKVSFDMKAREATSIKEFVDIWYSESMRERLKSIQIHG